MDKSSSSPKAFFSVQTIVLSEIVWAVLALLFFLLFSATLPGQEHPVWYSFGTTVFEEVAYFTAAWLCFRNWRSPQIVSGRNVWLCIGLGMLFYFLGGLFFFYWETVLGQEADVSPGDFFYVLTYIFLIVGILLAVASRRLNLELWQWGVVAVIAAISIVISWFVASPAAANASQPFLIQPVAAQTAPATKPTAKPTAKPTVKPTTVKASPKAAPAAKPKSTQPIASPSAPVVAPVPAAEQKAPETAPGTPAPLVPVGEQKAPPPAWALSLEETLKPLQPYVNGYYIVCDVLLLIIATTLLLAFWGGRFAQSWRMIAAAAFSLYVADIWFKYATTHLANYQSGGFLEVFWVFSGVLFGIGAALEHDLSSRTRSRTGGRRRATS